LQPIKGDLLFILKKNPHACAWGRKLLKIPTLALSKSGAVEVFLPPLSLHTQAPDGAVKLLVLLY